MSDKDNASQPAPTQPASSPTNMGGQGPQPPASPPPQRVYTQDGQPPELVRGEKGK